MAKKKFYAVTKGEHAGIYTDIKKVDELRKGCSGQLVKGFNNRRQAEIWLMGKTSTKNKKSIGAKMFPKKITLSEMNRIKENKQFVVYTDGSYQPFIDPDIVVGSYISVADENHPDSFAGTKIETINPNNELYGGVISEILAVISAMKESISKGIKHIVVIHDAEQIQIVLNDNWECKQTEYVNALSPYIKRYKELLKMVSVEFEETKAHDIDVFNNMVHDMNDVQFKNLKNQYEAIYTGKKDKD